MESKFEKVFNLSEKEFWELPDKTKAEIITRCFKIPDDSYAEGVFSIIKELVIKTYDPWFVYTRFFGCVISWKTGSAHEMWCEKNNKKNIKIVWEKGSFYDELNKETVKKSSKDFWYLLDQLATCEFYNSYDKRNKIFVSSCLFEPSSNRALWVFSVIKKFVEERRKRERYI